MKKTKAKKRWRPKFGVEYWVFGSSGFVGMNKWTKHRIDKEYYTMGNMFPTKAKAEAALKKVRKLLRGLR